MPIKSIFGYMDCQNSNISHTKSPWLTVSGLVLQLSLSDQKFYCLLMCAYIYGALTVYGSSKRCWNSILHAMPSSYILELHVYPDYFRILNHFNIMHTFRQFSQGPSNKLFKFLVYAANHSSCTWASSAVSAANLSPTLPLVLRAKSISASWVSSR